MPKDHPARPGRAVEQVRDHADGAAPALVAPVDRQLHVDVAPGTTMGQLFAVMDNAMKQL